MVLVRLIAVAPSNAATAKSPISALEIRSEQAIFDGAQAIELAVRWGRALALGLLTDQAAADTRAVTAQRLVEFEVATVR